MKQPTHSTVYMDENGNIVVKTRPVTLGEHITMQYLLNEYTINPLVGRCQVWCN